ncbi:MAG: hypothetical protein AMXMBFR13_08440 [Phycisphaerae bacterium]
MWRTTGLLTAVTAVGLLACGAHAEVLRWEFSVHPSQEEVPMSAYARGAPWDGGTANGTPYGGCIDGTGLQGDGTAVFADADCESDVSGFAVGGWSGDFTVDLRVKAIEDVGGDPRGKSISVMQANENSRGIALNRGNVTFKHGSGTACGPWSVDLASDFRIIRVSVVSGATNTATTHVWNGASWELLGSCTLGGTGGAGEIPAAGFAVGSLAGSSTTAGKFQIDYARADNAQALGDTVPPLPPSAQPCGSNVSPTEAQSVAGYAGGAPYPFATVDLGTADVSDGLTHIRCCDGMTGPVTMGGRDCRTNVNPPVDGYMYFAVDDALAFQGSSPEVTITFDYFDEGTGAIGVHYDGASSEWSDGPTSLALTDSKTWKRGSIAITDAYFGNREHAGSDFRIWRSEGAAFYIDHVMVSRGPGSDIDYILENPGSAAINWTAFEANADGTPQEYDWLVLSLTGGTLDPSTFIKIRASMDTSALTAGPRTVYLKFADGCPLPPPCLNESFSYPEGELVGQGDWTGSATAADIGVTTGGEVVVAAGAEVVTASTPVGCEPSTKDGVISVRIKVKAGAGENTLGYYRVLDTTGTLLGYCTLTGTAVKARNPLDAGVTEVMPLSTESYGELELRINTFLNQTEYWFTPEAGSAARVVTYPHAGTAGNRVGSIEFERLATSPSLGQHLFFDDLQVSFLDRFHLRRIDLNVVGCALDMIPRQWSAGTCQQDSSKTGAFTLVNNGVEPIAAFQVEEINQFGSPVDYPWLTLTYTSEPLDPQGTAQVTATVDFSQVWSSERAWLRFSWTCDGTNWLRDSIADAVIVSVPPPVVVAYLGDVAPDAADAAGPGMSFSVYEGSGTGELVNDPDACDRKAYRINDPAGSKIKWRVNPAIEIDESIGATIVARVKTVLENHPAGGNLFIFHSSLHAEYHWGGPAGHVIESWRGAEAAVDIQDDAYHILRMTARNEGGDNGIVIRLYVDENPIPALVVADASAHNSGLDSFGFGAGSTDGQQDVYFDFVLATNAGAFAPGEESGCLSLPEVCPPPCHWPFADTDGDRDVDQDDFGLLQRCFNGSNLPFVEASYYCGCLDRGDDQNTGQALSDGDIDSFDFSAFEDCWSGPDIEYVDGLMPDCRP